MINIYSEKWIDISYWQHLFGPGGAWKPIDLYEFLMANPEIVGVVIRFINNNGTTDFYYDDYYDAVIKAGRLVAGYGWPTPKVGADEWAAAMGERIPKMIWHDWEIDFDLVDHDYGDQIAHARLAAERWIEMKLAFPQSAHVIYTSVNYWTKKTLHHLFLELVTAKFPKDIIPVVLAQYPYIFDGKVWRQVNHWREMPQKVIKSLTTLPGDKIEIVGRQICSKGRLPGYKGDLDLDFMAGWFIGSIYRNWTWRIRKLLRLARKVYSYG